MTSTRPAGGGGGWGHGGRGQGLEGNCLTDELSREQLSSSSDCEQLVKDVLHNKQVLDWKSSLSHAGFPEDLEGQFTNCSQLGSSGK